MIFFQKKVEDANEKISSLNKKFEKLKIENGSLKKNLSETKLKYVEKELNNLKIQVIF